MVDIQQADSINLEQLDSNKNILSTRMAEYYKEKDSMIKKLEQKLIDDIQTMERLKYDFCDMLKFGEII
jgi:hypothetical protein